MGLKTFTDFRLGRGAAVSLVVLVSAGVSLSFSSRADAQSMVAPGQVRPADASRDNLRLKATASRDALRHRRKRRRYAYWSLWDEWPWEAYFPRVQTRGIPAEVFAAVPGG
jgi:hypothetical protein